MIGLLLLLLVVFAILSFWKLWKTTGERSVSAILEGEGVVPRGPLRFNISDAAYDRFHSKLGTNLRMNNVKKDPSHIAYIYNDKLAITWKGKPAVLLGFKDHALAGRGSIDYGHIVTKDGKEIIDFEVVEPVVLEPDQRVLKVRLTDVSGIPQLRDLTFFSEPTDEEKRVRFSV